MRFKCQIMEKKNCYQHIKKLIWMFDLGYIKCSAISLPKCYIFISIAVISTTLNTVTSWSLYLIYTIFMPFKMIHSPAKSNHRFSHHLLPDLLGLPPWAASSLRLQASFCFCTQCWTEQQFVRCQCDIRWRLIANLLYIQ